MRIDWTEDEDRPGQFALLDANCRRSIKGKADPIGWRIYHLIEHLLRVCSLGHIVLVVVLDESVVVFPGRDVTITGFSLAGRVRSSAGYTTIATWTVGGKA